MTNNTTTNERGIVVLEMSMSLDGLIAGPNVGRERPMGDGGERLHHWMFTGKTEREIEEFQTRSFQTTGAIVMGRRTFDLGVGPWGENPPFHAPCFVLSQVGQATITKAGGTTYTFVTDGIENVVAQARAAAGSKRIMVLGGANTAQQSPRAGLVDEIVIHLVPVLLGDGTRLFDHLGPEHLELEPTAVSEAPGVTHLRFRAVT
ncbi:MAG: dihydrofolate reductase family protein [Chloroflexota bacterium]|nr:dihydrofolate reductase family protein [Chloroflexota bacterium]